jgi:hypothetical protein
MRVRGGGTGAHPVASQGGVEVGNVELVLNWPAEVEEALQLGPSAGAAHTRKVNIEKNIPHAGGVRVRWCVCDLGSCVECRVSYLAMSWLTAVVACLMLATHLSPTKYSGGKWASGGSVS